MRPVYRRPLVAVVATLVLGAFAAPVAAFASATTGAGCGTPGIHSISAGGVTQSITVSGCHFGTGGKVMFWQRTNGAAGSYAPGTVTNWSDTSISVAVPTVAGGGNLQVVTTAGSGGTYTTTWTPNGPYMFQEAGCASGNSATPKAPDWHYKTGVGDLVVATVSFTGGTRHVQNGPGSWSMFQTHPDVAIWGRTAAGSSSIGPSFTLNAIAKWTACTAEIRGLSTNAVDVVGADSSNRTDGTWDSGSTRQTGDLDSEAVIAGVYVNIDDFSQSSTVPSYLFTQIENNAARMSGGLVFYPIFEPHQVAEATITDSSHLTFASRGAIVTFS